MEQRTVAVAIDGPAGAGKSTIARAVAQELGYLYVDTGALYRAIGLFAAENGIDPEDGDALVRRLEEADIRLEHRDGEQRVLLGGRDVTRAVRRPEMGLAASRVSAIPGVRAHLLDLQRDLARRCSVVMDGRDIGTVVLPGADVKIFLTASAEARARRRYREELAKGIDVGYNQTLEDIRLRDHSDENRAVSPLRQAEDARVADTSDLNLEESIRLVLDMIREGIR